MTMRRLLVILILGCFDIDNNLAFIGVSIPLIPLNKGD